MELKHTFEMIRAIRRSSNIKVSRHFDGFFADRLAQAATEDTLLKAIERLSSSVDVSMEFIGGEKTKNFIMASSSNKAGHILSWIRKFPKVAGMISSLKKDDDFIESIGVIDISSANDNDGSYVKSVPKYDIKLDATLTASLSHGSDIKAGNATLFRRKEVITETGRIMSLPFYSGNAIRGQIRDLLADHMLSSIGLTPRKDDPPIKLWFFHALYAGGVLEEKSKSTDKIGKELGNHGALNTDGIRKFRDTLPGLSILGTAVGNRIINGRISVGDLRPDCLEWGTGSNQVSALFNWEYLTRRDDHEGRTDEDKHNGMIATMECLKTGVKMSGGIDYSSHSSEIELSALARGIELLKSVGKIGASSRMGLGKVDIESDFLVTPDLYDRYLVDNKKDIISYLDKIGAIDETITPCEPDQLSMF